MYYDKKPALINAVCISGFSGLSLVSAVLCAVFLTGCAALWISLLCLCASLGFISVKYFQKYKAPFAFELSERGAEAYNGRLIPLEDIQCMCFNAALTEKNTGVDNPDPAVYAAAPLCRGLCGAAYIVTLEKKYAFVGLCDIGVGYEAASKLLADCQLTLTAPGQPTALYIYDRYKDKLK